MPRFFVAGANIVGGMAVLQGEDAEHVKVLRMRVGERVVLCDGAGTDYTCRLTRVGGDGAWAEIVDAAPSAAEPGVRAVVCAAMPKGDKAEWIVQKCTEAGAAEILFFFSARCVAHPKEQTFQKRLDRLRRVAEEAAKQSGRGAIPAVTAAEDLAGAISAALKTELPLLLHETGEGRKALRAAIREAGEFHSCAILTGPEGGFAPYEADLCRAA
ncbi:MAG: 16S rRNA (uracil(1498)-N(3))-methyltransferase, partial [Firmicutes bacterium]|nr:16S rRNA (uracil(1498)-N(3))-methyltransferase [Bacillota bacterium]